ncbi:MAG: prephenate dehydrogenase/arogenate dehydrogenase family protein [Phormidesmis sp.]
MLSDSARLEQIDYELIRLLGDRIALTQATPLPTHSAPAQALAAAGIPEFVWRTLQVSCAAAAQQTTPTDRPKQVTLIGGGGQMGQFFARQLAQANHAVQIIGSQDWAQAPQLLTEADLVLICVPTQQVSAVVRRAAAYLSPGCAIADVTSIKMPPLAAMLKHHVGPVMGLHPMFGPGLDSFLSQNVIVCSGRYPQAFEWLLNLIAAGGGHLQPCTPTEHDSMMATVQAMRHFSVLGLGVFLAQEQVDIGRNLAFASPSYRIVLNQITRLLGQDPALCIEIMTSSDTCSGTISRLATTYSQLSELIAKRDTAALKEIFESAQCAFADETERAFAESNYLIEGLSLFVEAYRNQALV